MEICDRKEAITYAIEHGEPGDIIVLAGKGHEDYQETKSQPAVMATKPDKIPFNVNENDGLPYLIQEVNIVPRPPQTAARLVVSSLLLVRLTVLP